MAESGAARGLGSDRPWLVALAALALGVALVALYDAALAPSRYAYSGDSASYIEMATSLRAEGRPLVTPWELAPADRDAVPQPLFPPGFAVLVAAFVPFTGDARSAALVPSRIAAALLPLLIVLLWRGAAAPAVLLAAGLWVLLSPGVRDWQFVAYSDVTALALAIAALGSLARPLAADSPPEQANPAWWLSAGLLAGACYAVRNAGLAVLVAATASLGYAWLRRFIGWRPVVLFAVGAVLPLAALAAYDLATFGTLWPYTMPPSVRPWTLNVADLATAQLEDLGLPASIGAALPEGAPVPAFAVLLAVGAFAWWRTRAARGPHLLLTILGLYAGGGGVLLVLSRSRFEWGNVIDYRNTLQYSFALALAALVAARVLAPPRVRRVAGALLLVSLAARAAVIAVEARAVRRGAPASWLLLDRDPAVMDAARAIAPGTFVASNAAVLFRIGGPRAVRELDVGGNDGDFAGSMRMLGAASGSRPAVFLLVCNEWTWRFSACRSDPVNEGPACHRLRTLAPVVAECRADGKASGAPRAPDAR